MSKEERKVPELRFKGYHDDWEQRKLDDVAEQFEYGLNASAIEYDGINKYIRITDIDDKNHKFDKSALTSPNIDLHSSYNYLLKKGDILFARTGASVGKTYIYDTNDGKVYYAGFLIRARINSSTNPEFIFQNTLTKNYYNFVRITSQRSGQPGINANEYKNYDISMPKIDEQDGISNFLKTIDNLVVLHQRKINILESQKKEYLNVMFSNNHYNPPLVRFRGFYENWSNNKLSNYLITSKLKNLDGFYGKKDVLSVSGVHGVVNQIKLQGRSFAGKSVLNYRVLNNEEIVYTKSPLKVAPHGIIKTNKGKAGIVSTLYAIYKTRENTNPNFVQTYFENELRLNKYLKPLVNKGAKNDMKVTDENVLNGLVSFPSLEEQMKISLFAERIENLIEVNQIQLNTIKRLKESYLRKMFL